MSRVGKQQIALPEGVTAQIKTDSVALTGPKGTLSHPLVSGIKVVVKEGHLLVERENEDRKLRALHGLYRSLLANMAKGVQEGFAKTLVLSGVGYRAQKQGKNLVLQLGFSHPIEVAAPNGIEFEVQGTNKVMIKGLDKEKVGQLAADIRQIREVEPYKGKGIMYEGERVRRKAGKAGKVGAKAA